MKIILHICPKDVWKEAQVMGVYRGSIFDQQQPFIHSSTPDQIIAVANRLFRGFENLVLLVIDEEKVKSEIKYEDADDGILYPHIYGPLNLDAVIRVVDFPHQPDGTFTLPSIPELEIQL